MLNTVTARQIQKDYKRIFDQVKETQKPIIVITNSKPTVAIVSLDFLERVDKPNDLLRLRQLELEAIKEHEEGKTKVISTQAELEEYIKEIHSYAQD